MNFYSCSSAVGFEMKTAQEKIPAPHNKQGSDCLLQGSKLVGSALNRLTRIFHVFAETVRRATAGEHRGAGDQQTEAEDGFV